MAVTRPNCPQCSGEMLRLEATAEWACWNCSIKLSDARLSADEFYGTSGLTSPEVQKAQLARNKALSERLDAELAALKRDIIYGKVQWRKKQETWDLFKPRDYHWTQDLGDGEGNPFWVGASANQEKTTGMIDEYAKPKTALGMVMLSGE